MQLTCIGLNNHRDALIHNLVEKHDSKIDFFDVYPETDPLLLTAPDAIILRDTYIHDKGINLSQVFRLNVKTCLIPLFLISDSDIVHHETFPFLSKDMFAPAEFFLEDLDHWVQALSSKPRLIFSQKGKLDEISTLEIISLARRGYSSGKLEILIEQNQKKGIILFRDGEIVGARTLQLEGKEAFFDILTWGSRGTYQFDVITTSYESNIDTPFEQLLDEGFKLLKDASIIWSLVPNNSAILRKTASESALADKAENFFKEKEEIYNQINGYKTIKDIVESSHISCPRVLSFLASLISMGDIVPVCNRASYEFPSEAGLIKPISVLVVDDSKLVGKALRKIFDEDEFKVVGQAYTGLEALEMIPQYDPDVITLDVEMPEMDGITALKHIMIKHPRPVVMISTLTRKGSKTAFDALRYGAVEVIEKPSRLTEEDFQNQKEKIREIVKKAAKVSVEALHFVRPGQISESVLDQNGSDFRPKGILAIGTGIGGYNTLLQLIPLLPPDLPLAYLVMTRMDKNYLHAFASYLRENTPMTITLPQPRQTLKRGHCYITTRDSYVLTEKDKNGGCVLRTEDIPPGSQDCNSMDIMFVSSAETFADNTIGIVLSGSGEDGVRGLRYIADMGGIPLVQKPESCLERELPTKVMKSVNSVRIVTLKEIPEILARTCGTN